MVSLKEEIEKALNVLIHQPFWKARRAVNMAMFDFGERHSSTNHKGQPIEHGRYALHIQCGWRFTQLDQIVVGSDDMYYPPDGSFEFPKGLEWDTAMGNLHDVRMKAFMAEHENNPLTVNSIEVRRAGFVSIFFTDEYTLDIFPANSSSGYQYNVEHWRFLNGENSHFVFTGADIES
jgi:hypothetical protein